MSLRFQLFPLQISQRKWKKTIGFRMRTGLCVLWGRMLPLS